MRAYEIDFGRLGVLLWKPVFFYGARRRDIKRRYEAEILPGALRECADISSYAPDLCPS
jgi:hypothetical protein